MSLLTVMILKRHGGSAGIAGIGRPTLLAGGARAVHGCIMSFILTGESQCPKDNAMFCRPC